MGNDDLDRLREQLANSADRRRGGSWRFLRKMAALLGVLRAMFKRKHRD